MSQTESESDIEARTDIELVQNRSEIVFLFDAVDCNPNGNPIGGSTRPRIDTQTNECIVTDVCLKQYVRQQFDHEGVEGVYILPPQQNSDNAPTRAKLLRNVLYEAISDVDEPEDIDSDILNAFYDGAIDVRLFGATLSISTNSDDDADEDDEMTEAIVDNLPQHIRGCLQFSPGRSMHPVEMNENYDTLSSVIATGEGKQQGGFGLDDHRIKYGYFRFHGLLNENAAAQNRLSTDDVEYFDRVLWRGLKNQTHSRAKMGQEPRVYLRVEYTKDNFHLGDLHLDVTLDESDDEAGEPRSKPADELRNIRDTCLDITDLCQRLDDNAEYVERVRVACDRAVQSRNGENVGTGEEFLVEELQNSVGEDTVEVIDVRELPAQE